VKIVVTNDDGFDAPGLEALLAVARAYADPVILAPETPQSGVGHQVTTHTPITVRRLSEDFFSVGGTPADCVRLALKTIVPDADWVLAGINPGANLGSDIYQSGTVAAAREAAILGCRSMAVSQYISREGRIDWEITGRCADEIVGMLLQRELPVGCYWNVNLPHPLDGRSGVGHRFCEPDPNPHRYAFHRDGDDFTYRGTIHERPRDPDRDVAVCFGGEVSISRLAV
jgi:5'-nucleotidase